MNLKRTLRKSPIFQGKVWFTIVPCIILRIPILCGHQNLDPKITPGSTSLLSLLMMSLPCTTFVVLEQGEGRVSLVVKQVDNGRAHIRRCRKLIPVKERQNRQLFEDRHIHEYAGKT